MLSSHLRLLARRYCLLNFDGACDITAPTWMVLSDALSVLGIGSWFSGDTNVAHVTKFAA
jgi:hypothetical protein